jgi:energy-coupling factor transport system ATP-binding protein
VPADPCVTVRDLAFRHAHATRPALRGVSLTVRRGEYLGIVGAHGAGKTTLALSLNGVVPHLLTGERSGSVEVAGHDPAVTPVRELARVVGVVIDGPDQQLSQATVADEVALGLEHQGVPPAEMDARIAEALDGTGLGGLEARQPATLSGGEQQRLAIACVLAMRPQILVLDEPLAGLDAAGRAAVRAILRRLHRDAGVTVIVAEHDVEALAEDAERIVALADGTIAFEGTPGTVFGDVEGMARAGLRPPQVTELAAALSGRTRGLPVTVDDAAAWLGGTAT